MIPDTVFLEPTTLCNLRCKYCCSQENLPQQRCPQSMSDELFERVLSQLLTTGIGKVNFWGFGEPFMHPHYVSMCRRLYASGIETTSNTNGHFLQDASAVAGCGLSKLIFSIDGATAETYSKYRCGGDFGLVMANLRSLIRERDSSEVSMDIVWQFIVFPWNEHEVDAVQRMAHDMGISCVIKTNLGLEDAPHDPRYVRQADERGFVRMALGQYENMGPKCHRPIILADGRIAMCLYDSQGEYILGDLNLESLGNAILSTAWQRLWRLQRSDNLELCRKRCSYWYRCQEETNEECRQ